jgi:hypothetical protein
MVRQRPSNVPANKHEDYAERLRERLEAIRAIPFDRELDLGQVKQDGIRLEDFRLSQS